MRCETMLSATETEARRRRGIRVTDCVPLIRRDINVQGPYRLVGCGAINSYSTACGIERPDLGGVARPHSSEVGRVVLRDGPLAAHLVGWGDRCPAAGQADSAVGHEWPPAGLYLKQRCHRQTVCLVGPHGSGTGRPLRPRGG